MSRDGGSLQNFVRLNRNQLFVLANSCQEIQDTIHNQSLTSIMLHALAFYTYTHEPFSPQEEGIFGHCEKISHLPT